MRSRVVILLTLTCLVAAGVASAATAGSQRRSDIPACEELLTVRQAAASMGEPEAPIVNRQVVGSTRVCAYEGGSKGRPLGHALGVNWGPYADVRKRVVPYAKTFICAESKAGCRKIN